MDHDELLVGLATVLDEASDEISLYDDEWHYHAASLALDYLEENAPGGGNDLRLFLLGAMVGIMLAIAAVVSAASVAAAV